MKLLILGFVWPETNASAAGLREWALVEHFLKQGWEVTYTSPAKENDFSHKLREIGVQTFSCGPNDSKFDEFVRALRPDVAIFDRFVIEEQFGWRIEEHSPETFRILDTIDLHSLRRAREAKHKAALQKHGVSARPVIDSSLSFLVEHAHEDFLREMASILRSDHAWVVSCFEKELLEKFSIPESQTSLLRFSYDACQTDKLPIFSDRKHFVSIGNFRHPPNADSIRWLKKEIWPELKKTIPAGVEFHVYGSYPPKEMMDFDDPKNGFRVLGPAVDQYETLKKYRILLAPLRFGAGIKGKISDAWWTGTSVVTTSIGAEGMAPTDCFPGRIADDVAGLAKAASEVYQDEVLWKDLQTQGFSIMGAAYSRQINQEKIISDILFLKKNQNAIREKNWLGATLRMNLHRSTRYFSQWIEAKNSSPE